MSGGHRKGTRGGAPGALPAPTPHTSTLTSLTLAPPARSNRSRVVNAGAGTSSGGEAGVNGADYGYRRAARGGTKVIVNDKGYVKGRKQRKKGENSFPRWWETGIKN